MRAGPSSPARALPGRRTACLYEVRPRPRTAPAALAPDAAPAGGTLLRVEELRKEYGGHVALGGVSLDVGAGESVGVVGESGSGKTTLARCVLGLATPDGGRVELAGLDVTPGARAARREGRTGWCSACSRTPRPRSTPR
ncbi:ATP-binding cassette domain-containing protein [Microtetraspora malaysiensis]|uniref:ATP-binding cassette domain-containing protein n=1 Tax=Microtetraspora malaysiensis TaxID=161358 RepID=UPI003D928E2C